MPLSMRAGVERTGSAGPWRRRQRVRRGRACGGDELAQSGSVQVVAALTPGSAEPGSCSECGSLSHFLTLQVRVREGAPEVGLPEKRGSGSIPWLPSLARHIPSAEEEADVEAVGRTEGHPAQSSSPGTIRPWAETRRLGILARVF